jgi:Flp pilus assembly protein CpaB
LLIIAAALLAFVFNFLALQERDEVTMVAIAAEPLTAGSILEPSSIEWVPIASDFEGMSGLIMEADGAIVDGSVVGEPLTVGSPILRSSLLSPGSGTGLRTISVPIGVEHAAGTTLRVGDRVDVISVVEGKPTFIATDLQVVDLANTSQGALAGGGPYYVLLAVSAPEALSLAGAIDDGSIEIVRSTGAAPIEEGTE